MTFQNFSAALISSGDLDPDYLVLKEIAKQHNFSKEETLNWILHKLFIYDTASEYKVIFQGADIERVRLGAERRKNKQNTVKQLNAVLEGFHLPAPVWNGEADYPYSAFKADVTKFAGIGDWAAWKLADLLENVMGIKINFNNVDFRSAYQFPLKGLCRVNDEADDYVSKLSDDLTYNVFMHCAIKQLGFVNDFVTPCGQRKINMQEIETCLCKYHSYLSGHYKIGQDSRHLVERFAQEKIRLPENIVKHFEQNGFITKLDL